MNYPLKRVTITLRESCAKVEQHRGAWRVRIHVGTAIFPAGLLLADTFATEGAAITHAAKVWEYLSTVPEVVRAWPPRMSPKQFILNYNNLTRVKLAKRAGWSVGCLNAFLSNPRVKEPRKKRRRDALVKALEYWGYVDYDNPFDLEHVLKEE